MQDFLQAIRTHFNIIHKDDYLSLTLINPNLDLQIIKQVKSTFRLMHHIKKQEIIIIQSVNFDDQLLQVLADALPESLEQLSLDFTGCQSLRGESFPHLFERLSSMSLRKLKLDLSEVFDINDVVIQSLSLLLENLNEDLQQFYLDLYEVDQITQQGYLLLAQSLTSLPKLNSLHLDFSANPNLTQDNLELFFMNLPSQKLKVFQFRILDIDHIGGGSFFTLGQSIFKMKNIQILQLTLSTFSNLNHKGTYSILKQICYLQKLKSLTLNISNIQLPQKVLSFINLPPSVQYLNLDISCNKSLTDGDILTLIKNVKYLSKMVLNLDFCPKITEDSIQQLLQIFLKNNKCIELQLPDRKYSAQLLEFIAKNGIQTQTLLSVQIGQISQEIPKQWICFQQYLAKKRNNIFVVKQCKTQNKSPVQINSILSVLN